MEFSLHTPYQEINYLPPRAAVFGGALTEDDKTPHQRGCTLCHKELLQLMCRGKMHIIHVAAALPALLGCVVRRFRCCGRRCLAIGDVVSGNLVQPLQRSTVIKQFTVRTALIERKAQRYSLLVSGRSAEVRPRFFRWTMTRLIVALIVVNTSKTAKITNQCRRCSCVNSRRTCNLPKAADKNIRSNIDRSTCLPVSGLKNIFWSPCRIVMFSG